MRRRPGTRRPGRSPSGSVTPSSFARASFWAGERWKSSTTSTAWKASWHKRVEASPDHSILIDKFLEDAIEIDVDAVCDGERTIVVGVMEHIEEAGIHSGDSACAIPPFSLPSETVKEIKKQTLALATDLVVRGLMNIQFAVKDGEVYILEVNPRASRTVPFVSKATGLNIAQAAARVMVGISLEQQGITSDPEPTYVSVKEAVFPFAKFPGVDIVLGPEMRSTGEVMGIATDFPTAFAKSQLAISSGLPTEGTILISVAHRDRQGIVPIARRLAAHPVPFAMHGRHRGDARAERNRRRSDSKDS